MAVALACLPITAASAAGLVGGCGFDSTVLAFAGPPADQARCLLRPVAKFGHVGTTLAELPPTLGGLIGTPTAITPTALRQHLDRLGLAEAAIGGSLDAPVSRAHGGKPSA